MQYLPEPNSLASRPAMFQPPKSWLCTPRYAAHAPPGTDYSADFSRHFWRGANPLRRGVIKSSLLSDARTSPLTSSCEDRAHVLRREELLARDGAGEGAEETIDLPLVATECGEQLPH